MCARARVRACGRARMRAYMRACGRVRVRNTCACAYPRVCTRVGVCVGIGACACMGVRMDVVMGLYAASVWG